MYKPKISIITVVKDSASTITDAIDSVLKQTYKNVEYIIIDGASSDGTVEHVLDYGSYISKFISEKDNGIYDAMNKGIKLATGEIIGILNSDDVYFDHNVLENIANIFRVNEPDCIYGDLQYVDKNNLNKTLRHWRSSDFKAGSFARGWHPPHPTFFVKKEIYNKYGLFDTQIKVSADFDLMLRFLEKYKISSEYIPKILVKMRTGGVSNNSLKNIITSNRFILKAFDKNKIKINKLAYVFYRLVPKIFQRIRKDR
tara:strand:- start:204 stop:971 length:768 start_codon:yes stop_codon:yes gene_type:complete